MKNNYYDSNFEFLNSFNSLSKDIYDVLFNVAKFKQKPANEILISDGVVPTKIYLVNKGVIRSFVRLANGKIVTKNIFTPTTFITSFTAMLENKPSEILYETLTETDLFELDYKDFAYMCNNNPTVMKLYASFLEFVLKEKDELNIELLSLDGKGRYLKLRERIPNIDNLIPQYQIASYLSITPVQLRS